MLKMFLGQNVLKSIKLFYSKLSLDRELFRSTAGQVRSTETSKTASYSLSENFGRPESSAVDRKFGRSKVIQRAVSVDRNIIPVDRNIQKTSRYFIRWEQPIYTPSTPIRCFNCWILFLSSLSDLYSFSKCPWAYTCKIYILALDLPWFLEVLRVEIWDWALIAFEQFFLVFGGSSCP